MQHNIASIPKSCTELKYWENKLTSIKQKHVHWKKKRNSFLSLVPYTLTYAILLPPCLYKWILFCRVSYLFIQWSNPDTLHTGTIMVFICISSLCFNIYYSYSSYNFFTKSNSFSICISAQTFPYFWASVDPGRDISN